VSSLFIFTSTERSTLLKPEHTNFTNELRTLNLKTVIGVYK
jgi:hypothetical protein